MILFIPQFKKIKKLMIERELSIGDISKAINKSRTFTSQMVAGRWNPDQDVAASISNVLQAPIDDLFMQVEF